MMFTCPVCGHQFQRSITTETFQCARCETDFNARELGLRVKYRGEYVCTQCATRGRGIWKLAGSGVIEIALYLLFCAPGVIYSVWRRSAQYHACEHCESVDLVRASSPKGKKLLEQNP
tara:strand:- start:215 stop:568 length:354 start_codon:yes stop_codon:yes gene_type:complete